MSREPSTVDADAWTGMSDWPSPKDYPRPSPLYAKASPGKHLAVGAGAAVVSLVGFYELCAPTKVGVMHAVAMGILAFGAAALAVALLRHYSPLKDGQWRVGMDSSGLHIPSWYDEAVPWNAIESAAYIPVATPMPMRGLHFTVRDESRFKPTRNRQLSQLIPFASFLWLLDVAQKEMFESIQAHRAHFGDGGRAI